MEDLHELAGQLAEAMARVDSALDWGLLGDLYCHEGGEGFFPPEQRDAIRDAGLAVAGDLGEHLAQGGASHYVGAAVAELPPILFETIVLGRRVHWTQLAGPELDELARVMELVGGPAPSQAPLPAFEVDHLWFASVLTDPEVFPALHKKLYEKSAGGGDLDQEHARATELVQGSLTLLSPPALLSTTDEEAPFFLTACRARGWQVDFPERGRLSGIVGDVVRHGTVHGTVHGGNR